MKVESFKDLMAGHDYAEIVCPYKGTVVRKLTKKGDTVEVDALSEKITVSLNTGIMFEPWFMDRGNMLFNENLKLCTEMDKVRFPDGSESSVEPSVAGE